MNTTVLVKLGGSLLTDKRQAFSVRNEVLKRLANEVARWRSRGGEALVLAHGSGSFGHAEAARSGLVAGGRTPLPASGWSRTQDAAARLHRRVIEALLEAQVWPFSLAPSSFVISASGQPVSVGLEPLVRALELGLVPVTFGDVVLDRETKAAICSTETVLQALARRLPRHGHYVRRVLWLGETDGIYDSDGNTIPRVSQHNVQQVLKMAGAAAGTDVTGGMRHRLETAWSLTDLGARSWLINGLEPGVLERALCGEDVPGTVVCRD